MARVRKFDTGVAASEPPATNKSAANVVPDIPSDAAERIASSAPIKIQGKEQRAHPRPRRYRQKTYSLLQEDIDLIETLVAEIRQAGLYERGRSDIVRAGVLLLQSLSLQEKLRAVRAVESLKS